MLFNGGTQRFRSGSTLADLIQGADETSAWSARYDRPMVDLFSLMNEITSSIIGTVEPAVLEREESKALATPEFRERLQAVGAEPVGGTIDDFKQRIRQETERWAKVIQFANIKAQ